MPPLARLFSLSLLLTGFCLAAARDDDDAPTPKQSVKPAHAAQPLGNLAGIATAALQAANRPPEFSAYGIVVNPEPLVGLRQQVLGIAAQQAAAEARYREADHNLTRTRNLHQQDIVSTRRLQEQQAQWQHDKANLAAGAYQQQALLAASRLQWGDTLTEWFSQNGNRQAENLLQHRSQLVQITLPAEKSLPPDTREITIAPQGRREQSIGARLVSAAPQVDPVSQGQRYFFQTQGSALPYGSRVNAWITEGAPNQGGVVIPESAVVWHLGQAFVYIESEPGEFKRRLLQDLQSGVNGYFAATGFQAGETIVVSGAQTLLSQELKNQIPNEDDD